MKSEWRGCQQRGVQLSVVKCKAVNSEVGGYQQQGVRLPTATCEAANDDLQACEESDVRLRHDDEGSTIEVRVALVYERERRRRDNEYKITRIGLGYLF